MAIFEKCCNQKRICLCFSVSPCLCVCPRLSPCLSVSLREGRERRIKEEAEEMNVTEQNLQLYKNVETFKRVSVFCSQEHMPLYKSVFLIQGLVNCLQLLAQSQSKDSLGLESYSHQSKNNCVCIFHYLHSCFLKRENSSRVRNSPSALTTSLG